MMSFQEVLSYFSVSLFIVSLILLVLLMDDKNLVDKKFEALPKDAIVDIKVTGRFYQDLKIVFSNVLIDGETDDSIGKILDNLSSKTITSMKEHQLYVLFVLIAQIETDAKEQGVTVKATVAEGPTL